MRSPIWQGDFHDKWKWWKSSLQTLELTAPQKRNQFQEKLEPALTLKFRAFLDLDELHSSKQMVCTDVHFSTVLLIRASTKQPISLCYCFEYTLEERFSSACKRSAWVFSWGAAMRLLGCSMWLLCSCFQVVVVNGTYYSLLTLTL